MKNLLGDKNWDDTIRSELSAAGIEVVEHDFRSSDPTCTLMGKVGNWTFRRAPHCWMARAEPGQGIPKFEAEGLNLGFREQVCVAGVKGGANVKQRLSQWQTIDSYDVFTQKGLKALALQIVSLSEL